jgi:RimJ/RimL family protein N-acetyltransferase
MLDGTNPGWVYVDDTEEPTCAWMVNSEGFFLAGNPDNKEFNAWMEDWFEDYIRHGNTDWESETVLLFDVSSDKWVSSFPEIFSLRPPQEVNRIHYLCSEVKVKWRELIPEGYAVHEIDESILSDVNLEVPDHLRFWIKMNWGTPEDYLKYGFGICVLHRKRIVSYSLADCVHGKDCEIGIQTLEPYRRRGLATIVAAANVELAFSKGFKVVGWHTHDYNQASQRTAEKVGFELERRYLQYECHRNEAAHIAETALRFFMKGNHERAAKLFEEAFRTGEVESWVYVLAARSHTLLGNFTRAFEHLMAAAQKGYSNIENILECSDFEKLHGLPDWSHIVAEIKANANSS